jgi:hypothetical protein
LESGALGRDVHNRCNSADDDANAKKDYGEDAKTEQGQHEDAETKDTETTITGVFVHFFGEFPVILLHYSSIQSIRNP